MAVLVKIHYDGQKDHLPSVMKNVIAYCLRPDKTEAEELLCTASGQNCSPALAYGQFMATKAVWKKENGVAFKHYVQSFQYDEDITPVEANAVAVEFAQRAWPDYEILLATHVDRSHLHTHFILNTVHPKTGKKIREDPENILRLRKISDEICAAHGLSVLPENKKNSRSRTMGSREYRSAYKGESWKMRLRAAICQAMAQSRTREEFISVMESLGYGVRWEESRQNITYTCYGESRFKDGSFRKCCDDKLNDDKYLKEVMAYEFEIRAEIIRGRADEPSERYSDDNENNTGGGDQRGGMGTAYRNDFDLAYTHPRRRKRAQENGEDADRYEDIHDGANERKPSGNVPPLRRTGWESERESCFSHRASHDPGRSFVGTSTRGDGTAYDLRAPAVGLVGLASALSSVDSGQEKTPEEIEAEERARIAADNTGALIGLAAGVVMNLLGESDDDAEEDTEEDENKEYDYDESDFDISM